MHCKLHLSYNIVNIILGYLPVDCFYWDFRKHIYNNEVVKLKTNYEDSKNIIQSSKINKPVFDERYIIADEAIFDAFLLILKEKELDKISVSDVIKKAGIVRSTFYNHYENIPALVSAIEDKTIHDIFEIMESFHPKNDTEICKSYFITICDYAKNNPFLAEILKSPQGSIFLEKAMSMFHHYVKNIMKIATPSEHSKEEFSYMVAMCIGSTLGVLHKWSSEDFAIPSETIANILTKTFMTGILPFMS